MAGAGFKTFNTGDVLTAADTNTYLMQQTVMVFADAAARTSALGANVAEGMFSYLKDTNLTYRYDGSNWLSDAGTTSPLTTKGDLWSYSTTDARLAAGNNGETLVADSAATTGLRWSSTPSASNPVINGAFDIWQRGTSFSLASAASPAYNADRWMSNAETNAAATVSRQVATDSTNLPNIQYCLRYQRNSGQTGTGTNTTITSFETVNSIPFAGKTITLSFYARAGANYSATSGALNYKLFTGTGTDQNAALVTYTGNATPINQTATLTTTWQRFSASATLSSTLNEMAIAFNFSPTGTAGAADYYEITGVQIDIGSVALPFRRTMSTLQGELAACQRYYQKSFSYATAPADGSNNPGQIYTTRQASSGSYDPTASVFLKVTMRTAPTVTLYNSFAASPAGQWSDGSTSGAAARAFSIGDNTFTLDNTDNAITAANQGIHYVASAEL